MRSPTAWAFWLFIVAIFAGFAVLMYLSVETITGTASADSCQRQKQIVVVDLDNHKHRHILDHVWDATRKGQPRRLTIDRPETDANRRASLRGIPTKPGYDRDEYPPAMSDQGGEGADVRYVRLSENRSAGAIMGNQLRPYCNGQRFRFERKPR